MPQPKKLQPLPVSNPWTCSVLDGDKTYHAYVVPTLDGEAFAAAVRVSMGSLSVVLFEDEVNRHETEAEAFEAAALWLSSWLVDVRGVL